MIQQLHIQNFRSLRDVTFDLQRVNLLIGPNNCGKTNVLKALKFFSDFLVDKYPSDKAAWQTIPFRSQQSNTSVAPSPISLKVCSESRNFFALLIQPEKKDNEAPEYALIAGHPVQYDLDEGDLLDMNILDAKFDEVDGAYVMKNGFTPPHQSDGQDNLRTNDGVSFYRKKPEAIQWRYVNRSALRNIEEGKLLKNIAYPLQGFTIYRPDPNKLLDPYPLRPEETVDETASNLTAFLQEIRNKYPDVYERILTDLQRFVPEYTAISFEYVELPENDPLRMKYAPKSYSFYKIGLIDKYKHPFWVENLSEGILYFLTLLAIIHQPNPPKLLLIEEPEKGIHPRRIREVLDLIFELAAEKDIQVIMTTHSPLVVDRFNDIPESVFVLEKPNNETIVRNLQRDIIEPLNEKFIEAGEEPIPYTEALGEHWVMGFLGGIPDERL